MLSNGKCTCDIMLGTCAFVLFQRLPVIFFALTFWGGNLAQPLVWKEKRPISLPHSYTALQTTR